ncbi:MAG: dihydroorotase [Deltaproteobacteria bacterium]|nr:dihydroorotase [Deltaproteobacteria bacterium]
MVVTGGTCVTPSGTVEVDLGVRDGRVVALGSLAGDAHASRFDARGLLILPGIIDSQVHLREPGLEHKETISSGTAAALLGGVTTVLDMPNTIPPTTTPEALADKVARVSGRSWTDIAFFVGATPGNASTLGALERLPGCAGVKLFMGSSTGSLLVHEEAALAEAMSHGTRRMAVHAEDEARLRARRHLAETSAGDVRAHPVWRDEQTARLATDRCLRLARRFGRRVHILHVTTAEELDALAEHRDLATIEVTPQHLTLAAPDCYERLGTLAQMNPPIRDARHREALWSAIRSGLVDVVGSDHAPHSLEEKRRPYPQSPSGMPGVQTLLPLMLTHVHEGRLSLSRLVDLTAAGPARVYGMARKGRIAAGMDADLTLVDPKRRVRLTNAMMRTACGWSPFDGFETVGFPVAAFLRGRLAMCDGELVGEPSGHLVMFEENLPATSLVM